LHTEKARDAVKNATFKLDLSNFTKRPPKKAKKPEKDPMKQGNAQSCLENAPDHATRRSTPLPTHWAEAS
jgi:hypothetical protein